MTDYGPDHAAAVDRHLREQDRLADLEAAADRERQTLQVGDKVRLLENIETVYDEPDGLWKTYLHIGMIGEVVRHINDDVWLVWFGGFVGDEVVSAADLERIHDD